MNIDLEAEDCDAAMYRRLENNAVFCFHCLAMIYAPEYFIGSRNYCADCWHQLMGGLTT